MCQWGEEEIKFHSICITRASGKHRSAETELWKLKYRIEMKELAPVCLLLAKMWTTDSLIIRLLLQYVSHSQSYVKVTSEVGLSL